MSPVFYAVLFVALALGVSIGYQIRGMVDKHSAEVTQICPICMVPSDMVREEWIRGPIPGICSSCGQRKDSPE